MQWTYPFFLLAVSIGVLDGYPDPSVMEILVDTLFKSYHKNVRPGAFHTNTTSVRIGLAPVYVTDLDEEKFLFSLECRMQLEWVDNRLSWNPLDYMEIKVIRISDSFLWLPDITVYNSPSKHSDPKTNTNVLLYSTGKVRWISPSNIVSFCPLRMTGDYPDDYQTCGITLGSWTYDGWSIDLVVRKETYDLGDFLNVNPRWEVLLDKSRMIKVVKHYSCCKEPYVNVVAQFALRRRTVANLVVVKAPCVLALILTLLTFWIPPRSRQKIIVGAFLLLMLTALLVYVASSTKFEGAKETAVSFIRSSMYVVTSAIVLEIVLMNFIRCLKYHNPPKLLVKVLPSGMTKLISASLPKQLPDSGESKPEETKLSNNHMEENENVEKFVPAQKTVEPSEQWDMVAFLIEKIMFLIYVIVVVSLTV